jgi:hypothetical protein
VNLAHVGGKATGDATYRTGLECSLGEKSATRKSVLRRNAQSGSWSIRHSQVPQIERSGRKIVPELAAPAAEGRMKHRDDNGQMTGFGSGNSVLSAGQATLPRLCIPDDLHDSNLGKDVPARVSLLLRFS